MTDGRSVPGRGEPNESPGSSFLSHHPPLSEKCVPRFYKLFSTVFPHLGTVFPNCFSGSSSIRLLRGSGFTGKVRREGFFRDIFSFPVLSRRCPGKFTKSSREIIGIWNSDLIRDFGNRKGGALQEMGGPPQHRVFPVLPGRDAGFLLELRIKCRPGNPAGGGDLIDGIISFRQKFLRGPDRRGDL